MRRPSCDEHPAAPAIARCAVCGRNLCRDCVRESGNRAYCQECLEGAARRPEPAGEAGRGYAEEGAPAGGPPSGRRDGPPTVQGGGGPVAASLVASCAFHPGVRAVTRCSNCGAFICSGCQRIVGGSRLCEGCFRLAYAGQAGQTARTGLFQRGQPSFARAPWKLWPGLAFLPLPFVLSGIMTYMMRHGEEISVGAAQFLMSLLLYSSMLFFAFTVVSRFGPALAELGFSRRNLPSSLGVGFIGGSLVLWLGVAAAALSVGIFSRLDWIETWLQGFWDVNVKNTTGTDLLIAGIIIVIAAPICEEIFFRGYLYPPMRNSMGMWGAVLLNGFIFSAVHFSIFGLIGRTLSGAVFCLLYEYNDNLWSPITAHAMNNFIAFFLPLVYLSG